MSKKNGNWDSNNLQRYSQCAENSPPLPMLYWQDNEKYGSKRQKLKSIELTTINWIILWTKTKKTTTYSQIPYLKIWYQNQTKCFKHSNTKLRLTIFFGSLINQYHERQKYNFLLMQLSYPPILGAHNQKRPLCECTKRDALAILTINWFGLLFKYWLSILKRERSVKF